MSNRTRTTVLYIITALAMAVILFGAATAHGGENPCGNHGNNCCTNDGGSSFVSVAVECNDFCSSTASAVAVAVSECEAKASAACFQVCRPEVINAAVAGAFSVATAECEAAAAAQCAQQCGIQVANATASATAACAQSCVASCSEPICLNSRKKSKTIAGVQYTVTICREVK